MCQRIDQTTGRCLDVIQPINSIGIRANNPLDRFSVSPIVQTNPTTQQTQTQGKFFDALNNLMPLIQTSTGVVAQLDTNKTQREIAQRQVEAAAWQAQASQQGFSPFGQPQQQGSSTWLIVGGVAIVAIILVVVLMKK